MARGMKRHTAENADDRLRNRKAFAISKNDWMVLYTDLYRQTHGETAPIDVVYTDALKRLEVLKANGLV